MISNKASSILAGMTTPQDPPVGSKPATVSAIREDGKVNLAYQGGTVLGAKCFPSYTNRKVGDQVQVIYCDGQWTVLGTYGSDPNYTGPANSANRYRNYNFNSLTAGNAYDLRPAQQGFTNQGIDTVPLFPAWQYYNGSTNNLTSVGAVSTIKIWMARQAGDGGLDGAVALRLNPHGYDTLPESGFTTLAGYTGVSFTLERGEVRVISLPSDWVSAITAATIKGVCATPTFAVDVYASYCQLSPTSGGFTAS